MARVSIPVTQLDRVGEAPPAQTNADSVNNHQIDVNNGRTFVEIVSTDAGSQTVAFEIPTTVDGQATASKVVTVPAGATRLAGPWPTNLYNQPASTPVGALYLDPSVSTTLKFRVYSI